MHAELIKIKKRWSERIKIRLPSVESTWTPATANNRVWLSVLERADFNGKYLHPLDAGLRAFRGSCEQTDQFPRCTVSMGKQLTHLCRPLFVEILSISIQTINLCDLSTGGAGEHATVCIRKVENVVRQHTAGVLADKIVNFLWENNLSGPWSSGSCRCLSRRAMQSACNIILKVNICQKSVTRRTLL